MYEHILVPVDNSKHSDEAVRLAVRVAEGLGANVTAFHAYAARLHETRFRQMEPGLPGRYQDADGVDEQRSAHESLISDGLRVISDSYLDHAEEICRERAVGFGRRLAEGSNYVEVLREIGRDGYQLVAMGSLGLGARRHSVIGSVSERVLRRAPIDVLLARKPQPESRGVVAASDGSPAALRAVETAARLATSLDEPLEIVSVFDPQFHIVAFRSIAGVLSAEGARLFRFAEQRKLHEEIIDDGLEKLYRGYLEQAARAAEEAGRRAEPTLLKGKPFERILEHVRARKPVLLVVGRFGMHRTEYADMGSTSENLARLAACSVLVVNRASLAEGRERLPWTLEAEAGLSKVPEGVARELTRQRVEQLARELGRSEVTGEELDEMYRAFAAGSVRAERALAWSDDALARVQRIPEFVRGMAVKAIEVYVAQRGDEEVSSPLVDEAMAHWGATGRFHSP